MKREGYLFNKLVSKDNIKEAVFNASKGKHHKSKRERILRNFDRYYSEIAKMLLDETYVPSNPEQTILYEKISAKERVISKIPFYPDQIIGHAVIQTIMPIITRGLYRYTCSNIPGRGTIFAKRSCERFIRKDPRNSKYCLKMDITKFYPSISQSLLKQKLRRVIKDGKLLRLLDKIIEIVPSGLPIGTYTSQWLSNFYLQDLDHFIKEKCLVKYYLRYADDLVLLGSNKRRLYKVKHEIDSFLDLQIKNNWKIFRIDDRHCVDFVGYKIYRHRTAIRKRIFRNIRRLMLRIIKKIDNHKKITSKEARSFFSYYGYIKNSDSYYLNHTYLKDINIYRMKRVLQS